MRGGIVGCGFFAQFHTEAWQRIAGVQLVASCDLDLSRAQAAAPVAYTDLERMLDQEKLDFLDINNIVLNQPCLIYLLLII